LRVSFRKETIQTVSSFFVITSFQELLAFLFGEKDARRKRFQRWPQPQMRLLLICWWKLLGVLVQFRPKAYKSEVTDDKKSNKRIKRTSTLGKYTKSAYGARMYGGWMTSRLLRFNELYEEVQADRLKNGEMVEDNYLQHCIDNKISAKKVAKTKNCDVIAICEDLTEYL